jgi:DNA-binding winged helix-turn-helix (wHTH) protein/Tol biopolymer transport system component
MDDAARPGSDYRFLEFRYEPERRRLAGPAGDVRLKPLSDRLLRCLLDAPGVVLSRERLIDTVWTRREVNDEVLSRAIAELRAMLGDDAREPRFVETLSKGGYRWITPVVRGAAPSPAVAEAAPFDRTGRIAAAIGAAVLIALGVWLLVKRGRDDAHDPARLAVGLLGAHPLAADPRLEYDARFDGPDRVVYVRSAADSAASELVLIDTSSLAERVLWRDAASLRDPAPSPDGREVAVTRREARTCEIWSVALVDLRRTRLGDCEPSVAGGLEWVDGGNALIYSGPAGDAAHAPGLVLFDRRDGTHRALTTPDIAEGAHVDPRLSSDGAKLAYASRREGEAQVWETDWPALKQRTALLDRPEPVYGQAFEPDRDALWVAGDLTLYRALNRVRTGHAPELIGGRGAISIDIARDGSAVWSEANYDADLWLRAKDGSAWMAIARSTGYESQPEFSADGSRIAFVSNRNGTEAVFVYDRRDESVRPLPLDPKARWVRPSWSAHEGSLIITAYEDRHTRLFRYRLDDDAPKRLTGIEDGGFAGIELADRLIYMTGNGTGRGMLMQLRADESVAENVGLETITAFRASNDWLVWRTDGSASLHAAPWPALKPVREIAAEGAGEDFTLAGAIVYYTAEQSLWSLRLPDGEPQRIESEHLPNGNGPTLGASQDGAIAVVALGSVGMDLMIARPTRE